MGLVELADEKALGGDQGASRASAAALLVLPAASPSPVVSVSGCPGGLADFSQPPLGLAISPPPVSLGGTAAADDAALLLVTVPAVVVPVVGALAAEGAAHSLALAARVVALEAQAAVLEAEVVAGAACERRIYDAFREQRDENDDLRARLGAQFEGADSGFASAASGAGSESSIGEISAVGPTRDVSEGHASMFGPGGGLAEAARFPSEAAAAGTLAAASSGAAGGPSALAALASPSAHDDVVYALQAQLVAASTEALHLRGVAADAQAALATAEAAAETAAVAALVQAELLAACQAQVLALTGQLAEAAAKFTQATSSEGLAGTVQAAGDHGVAPHAAGLATVATASQVPSPTSAGGDQAGADHAVSRASAASALALAAVVPRSPGGLPDFPPPPGGLVASSDSVEAVQPCALVAALSRAHEAEADVACLRRSLAALGELVQATVRVETVAVRAELAGIAATQASARCPPSAEVAAAREFVHSLYPVELALVEAAHISSWREQEACLLAELASARTSLEAAPPVQRAWVALDAEYSFELQLAATQARAAEAETSLAQVSARLAAGEEFHRATVMAAAAEAAAVAALRKALAQAEAQEARLTAAYVRECVARRAAETATKAAVAARHTAVAAAKAPVVAAAGHRPQPAAQPRELQAAIKVRAAAGVVADAVVVPPTVRRRHIRFTDDAASPALAAAGAVLRLAPASPPPASAASPPARSSRFPVPREVAAAQPPTVLVPPTISLRGVPAWTGRRTLFGAADACAGGGRGGRGASSLGAVAGVRAAAASSVPLRAAGMASAQTLSSPSGGDPPRPPRPRPVPVATQPSAARPGAVATTAEACSPAARADFKELRRQLGGLIGSYSIGEWHRLGYRAEAEAMWAHPGNSARAERLAALRARLLPGGHPMRRPVAAQSQPARPQRAERPGVRRAEALLLDAAAAAGEADPFDGAWTVAAGARRESAGSAGRRARTARGFGPTGGAAASGR